MYLILHKVREAPAFDIAEKLQCPECSDGCDECDHRGYWWICSTSGHRAHPYKWWDMADMVYDPESLSSITAGLEPPPPSWPDHYRVNKAPDFDAKAFIKQLLKDKPKPQSDFKRRI